MIQTLIRECGRRAALNSHPAVSLIHTFSLCPFPYKPKKNPPHAHFHFLLPACRLLFSLTLDEVSLSLSQTVALLSSSLSLSLNLIGDCGDKNGCRQPNSAKQDIYEFPLQKETTRRGEDGESCRQGRSNRGTEEGGKTIAISVESL
mmetsp:Transcript_21211/g.42141  ORF Transcript_21211/g.42141 Transcript_21211/m.42141 type:complete len:147 (-) Transcript_21211:1451-1891(-)